MKFNYKDYFKTEPSTGYETLIYDCMIGDNILFQRAETSRRAGVRCSRSWIPGRRPATRDLNSILPAALDPSGPSNSRSETAAAGGSPLATTSRDQR